MKKTDSYSVLRGERALTFVEMLIVASLISIIGLALYNSLANGLKVWERSQRWVKEEDIVLLFDKLSLDLRNTFVFSKIRFEGNDQRFSFPTIVRTMADRQGHFPEGEYHEQMGKVEYYYDPIADAIYKRQANYSQAIDEKFQNPQLLAKAVTRVKFDYFYWTDKGELQSEDVLDIPPSGLQITIEFSDRMGRRQMSKFIEIPVGG